jgi:DNA polymerase
VANRDSLEKIAKEISSCQKCPLYQDTKNSVPGDGSADSGIVFIGEAPGQKEDQKGIPFCGRAGEFLNEMLTMIDLDRDKVFIGNVIKHRPPNNRDPEIDEIERCFPYLLRQLNLLKPQLIITLGRYAMNVFLPEQSISQVHGQPKRIYWQHSPYFKDQEMYQEQVVILPLYHPAAGLYRASMKDEIIKDFKKIPKIMKKIN